MAESSMTKPSYEELERRIRELDASESQVMEERDAAENALQETHIALGGDGEWVGKMPPEYPPDSGDLKLDVPELAAQLTSELARVRGLLQRLRLKSEDAKVVRIDSIKDWRDCEVRDWSVHHPLGKLTHDYYAEAFRNGWGDSLAPITLYVTAKGEHELEDGFHRLSAAIATGQEYINAQFLEESAPRVETGRSTKWAASEPLDYDAHVVKGFIEVSAPNDFCFTALFPLRKDAEDYIAWKNSQGAESADIGKLDSADKKHVCGMAGFNMLLGDTCPPCEARLAGSAETGGEKAAPQNDFTYEQLSARYQQVIRENVELLRHKEAAQHVDAIQARTIRELREALLLPTLRHTSQNQTASSGVEGAHEGTTADKFNCSETEAFHRAFGVPCSKCELALAESSLSSPPPKVSFVPPHPESDSTKTLWECTYCQCRWYESGIDLGEIICTCGKGKGRWGVVNGHLLDKVQPAAENSPAPLEASDGQTKPQESGAASPELLPTQLPNADD